MIEDRISIFLREIGELEEKLLHTTFNYCAIRSKDRFVLVQGRLFFNTVEPAEPFSHFSSDNVKAGQFKFSDLKVTAEAFLQSVAKGRVTVPEGVFEFPSQEHGGYRIVEQRAHPAGLPYRNRIMVLTLGGADRRSLYEAEDIDWELKAAATPYDTLNELLGEYRLGFVQDSITFEVVVPNVAQVDLSGRVQGTTARLGVLLALGLQRESASLGYRIVDASKKVVERGRLTHDQLSWEVADGWQQGRALISVPSAAVVQCIASYEGKAQNHGYIADPNNSLNDRRSAYEVFDPELKTLKEFMLRTAARGAQARDLEAAASWLFWMLGFNVAALGFFPKTQEAPDLVVTSRRGDYFAVECTMGMLRAENKLATVVRRAAQIREALNASGNTHLKVLPMMVTSLSQDEISAEMEAAEKAGLVVIAREQIEAYIAQTIIGADPDLLYEQAAEAVTGKLAKYG